MKFLHLSLSLSLSIYISFVLNLSFTVSQSFFLTHAHTSLSLFLIHFNHSTLTLHDTRTHQEPVASIISIADISSETAIYASSGQTIELRGLGITEPPSKWTATYSCGNNTAVEVSPTSVSVSYNDTSSMTFTSLDFSSCSGIVYFELISSTWQSQCLERSILRSCKTLPIGVGTVLDISDTSSRYGIYRSSNTTLLVDGSGFIATNSSEYDVTVKFSGGSCSPLLGIEVRRVSITRLELLNVDITSCSSDDLTISVDLIYQPISDFSNAGSVMLSSKTIGKVLHIFDTSQTKEVMLLDDGISNVNILVSVHGFGTSVDITPNNVTMLCDNTQESQVSDVSSVVYSDSSRTLLQLTVLRSWVSACAGTLGNGVVAIRIKYPRSDESENFDTLVDTNVGTVVSIDNTLFEQGLDAKSPNTLTIQGSGFLATDLSNYEVTMYCSKFNQVENVGIQVIDRVDSRSLKIMGNFSDCGNDDRYEVAYDLTYVMFEH